MTRAGGLSSLQPSGPAARGEVRLDLETSSVATDAGSLSHSGAAGCRTEESAGGRDVRWPRRLPAIAAGGLHLVE